MNLQSLNAGSMRCAIWIPWLLIALIGCGAEKESLHEEDHEVPSHWPMDFSDAVSKMEQRVGTLSSANRSSEIQTELMEIVGWVPEIAADTELSEEAWIPIYRVCETLRRHLEKKDVDVSAYHEDFERLYGLLRDSQLELDKKKQMAEAAQQGEAG